jgi:cytochrome c oxidase subunit II
VRKGLIIQLLALSAVFGAISFVVAYFIPWMPDADSKEAERIHDTYWLATIICLVIISLVGAATVYAVYKFRARPDDEEDGKHIHGHTGLEILWTAIPTVLVILIGVVSAVVLVKNEDLPETYNKINVKGVQFIFSFSYPEIDETLGAETFFGELHVPVDEAVELSMTADDVIHSFWVPEWSIHQDLVPGTVQRVIMTPTKEGDYSLICSELCGIGHATMRNRVVVQSRAEYDAWIQEQIDAAQGAGGGGEANGAGCHVLAAAGSTGEIGPNLDTVLPGQSEEQIRESIVDPDAVVTEGYAAGLMPSTFGSDLSEEQLAALVTYVAESAGN